MLVRSRWLSACLLAWVALALASCHGAEPGAGDAGPDALVRPADVVGPDRLGDVVLDLDSAALAAWLASPTAT